MTDETPDEGRALTRSLFSHPEAEPTKTPEHDADRAFARALFSNDQTEEPQP